MVFVTKKGVGVSVETAELADNSVTTAKIADANVTAAKLASGVGGAMILIADTTIGSDTQAVSFDSIATGYKQLILICTGRGASDTELRITFNDDTGSNYESARIQTLDNTVTGTTFSGAYVPVAQIQTTKSSQLFATISNTTATAQKSIAFKGGSGINTTGIWYGTGNGHWTNTADEIVKITITAFTFMMEEGFRLTLYGIK